jgi:ferric-dicitrate binding protein FerR (iron transport regulator)
MKNQGLWDRVVVVFLCLLFIPSSVWSQSSSAGQITALTPAASRNSRSVNLKEEIGWNDVLKTDRSGRTRLTLRDGSILSLGSSSELKVVEHEPVAQQTILQLDAGRVRSRVVSLTHPSARFEVRTPVATASVRGTDFFTEYLAASGSFRLICYSGVVEVKGSGDYAGRSETVRAGQMIVIGPNGFGPVQATANALQQDSIAQTTSESDGSRVSDSHLLRNVLIGAAVAAAGVVVGLVTTGAGEQAAQPQPGTAAEKRSH